VKKIKMIILGTILLAFALPKVVKRIKNGLIRQNEELRRELSEKQAKIDRFTEVVRAYDATLLEAISKGQQLAAENGKLWKVVDGLEREVCAKQSKIECLKQVAQDYDGALMEAVSRISKLAADNGELWQVLK
jgi:chromosome segregation ATPase